ncbi:unnamed protein product [Orchesella dallaii]|uniref:Uncharacterized protein n=1 Tax=Orchesella dallaii TaxID=48710 RepID=A0ABP1PTB9_9HEXA
MDVILLSDFLQQKPLGGYILTTPEAKIPEDDYLSRINCGIYLQAKKFTFVNNIRAATDILYCNLLEKVRINNVSDQYLKILETRLFDNVSNEERDRFKGSIRLFPFKKQVDNYNQKTAYGFNTTITYLKPELSYSCAALEREYPIQNGTFQSSSKDDQNAFDIEILSELTDTKKSGTVAVLPTKETNNLPIVHQDVENVATTSQHQYISNLTAKSLKMIKGVSVAPPPSNEIRIIYDPKAEDKYMDVETVSTADGINECDYGDLQSAKLYN